MGTRAPSEPSLPLGLFYYFYTLLMDEAQGLPRRTFKLCLNGNILFWAYRATDDADAFMYNIRNISNLTDKAAYFSGRKIKPRQILLWEFRISRAEPKYHETNPL